MSSQRDLARASLHATRSNTHQLALLHCFKFNANATDDEV